MLLLCRGVATISGISVNRQVSEAEATTEPTQEGAAQPQQLLLWPQCGECQQPLMQPALEIAQPRQELEVQLLVQPSNKPARLYITHHGQVRCILANHTIPVMA